MSTNRTRNRMVADYLEPLLNDHFPNYFLLLLAAEDSLDVIVSFLKRETRITYEQMRDKETSQIIASIQFLIGIEKSPAASVDYLDGRLHWQSKELPTLSPLCKRLDDAILKYAQTLMCETLEKMGKLPNEKTDSSREFRVIANMYAEIAKLEEKCN